MIERVSWFGLPGARRISNGEAEAVVTTGFGPRIIRYGLQGGRNLLGEFPEAEVKTELGAWKPWGGHRLWTSPEGMPRSYVPDNGPAACEEIGELSVRVFAPVEGPTGIAKTMEVSLASRGTELRILHRIANQGLWEIEAAPWALTILASGGTVIVPQEPFRPHPEALLPARPMVLWHYTDLADPRWTLGTRFVRLRNDPSRAAPQKMGFADKRGWAAYHVHGSLFIKSFAFVEGAAYPDHGCNLETFTAGDFVELETLGTLARLAPGAGAEHEERWRIAPGVGEARTEDEVAAALAKAGIP